MRTSNQTSTLFFGHPPKIFCNYPSFGWKLQRHGGGGGGVCVGVVKFTHCSRTRFLILQKCLILAVVVGLGIGPKWVLDSFFKQLAGASS